MTAPALLELMSALTADASDEAARRAMTSSIFCTIRKSRHAAMLAGLSGHGEVGCPV